MQSGIRVELRIEGVTACPMAQVSNETGASCELLARSVPDRSADTVTEVFTADAGLDIEDETERLFSYGTKCVYRTRRKACLDCPCDRFDRFGYPLLEARTNGEDMRVIAILKTVEELQRVVDELRAEYPRAVVDRLAHSEEDASHGHNVLFDVSRLTDRQREVLERAYAMGYFEYPRQSNSGEVADSLDITRSTFVQHLTAAQAKLFGALLDS